MSVTCGSRVGWLDCPGVTSSGVLGLLTGELRCRTVSILSGAVGSCAPELTSSLLLGALVCFAFMVVAATGLVSGFNPCDALE
jgi:hypothetical protein